ncbi:MAG TPA: hypothetical protein VNB95_00300 [Nitrososphaera sp.]|nr:hypothetical protein [Nitrososphaera sp.]
MFSPGPEWTISFIVARCSAQAWALAASVSLHTSGGTPTAARSLLCTARMLLAQSALIPPVLLAGCGIAVGGGVSVAGGASVAGGGVSVAGGASVAGGGVSVAGGGACVVSPSPAGGGVDVAQLPLASGVEPSGHDCAYEDCNIDNDDDCTVRIAAVTRITLIIIIDSLLYMICSSCLE